MTAELQQIDLGSDHPADLMTDRESCGTGGCGMSLYATYDGCSRQLGEFFVAAIEPFGTSPAGWPLLVTTSHCNASNYGVVTHQLLTGAYVAVDSYLGCTFDGPPTEARPPFHGECSEDEPCRRGWQSDE